MSKGVKLLAVALCLSTGVMAQEVKTDSILGEDDFDFSLTEGQIDEDAEAASTVTLVTSASDPYTSQVGYQWGGAMRFKYRALDNQYVGNYINGIMFNNVETGRFSYGGITGGLNDAVRNKDGANFLEGNRFGYAPLGGASNIDLRASHYAAGHKLSIAGTNRSYVLRGTYTYASGLLQNGWAFMGALAYRWANEGVIEGTFYNAFSYMLGAEKYINDRHHLSLVTWGAPTERGQQGAATEEAYWLAGSHYYNPYWGYQDGKKRNSRVVNEFSPSVMATWDFDINDKTKLTTAAAATFTNYSSTALSYNNAYNPNPVYYKNLPSSAFNVYNSDFNNSDWLSENPGVMQQYNSLYEYWISSKANRQVNWDRLYAQNQANNTTGKSALYYQERRHNDQKVFHMSSVLDGKFSNHGSYNLGLNYNYTRGHHYKTMADMLGANTFIDVDNYSLNKYGSGSNEYQNDLDNPNRNIKKGDIFGYNYLINVHKIKGFGSNTWKVGNFTAIYGADIEGTFMERYGKMRNGRAANFSKGSSGWAKFLGGGGKALLRYDIATSYIYLGGSIESQAPLAYNSFVAPRIHNNFADNLKNEWYYNAEVGYQWYFGPVSGKVSAYYTRFNDVTQQTAFYNDDASYLTYLTMTGIQKEHKGIEAAISVKLYRNLKLNLMGTISDAKYINNPLAQLAYEGSDPETVKSINTWTNEVTNENRPLQVFMDNVKIGSTPLTAASIGLSYNINGWYFDLDLNYYDRVYVGASSYRRLGNATEAGVTGYASTISDINVNTGELITAWDYAKQASANGNGAYVYEAQTGEILASYGPKQEKFDGGFMLDASIGKSLNLRNGKRMTFNLQVQNITNNTKMRTGGYEQNRADRAYDYKFSANSYYYYASAINAFLNIGYKF